MLPHHYRSSCAAATWGPSLPRARSPLCAPRLPVSLPSANTLTDLLIGSYFPTLLNKSFLTSFLHTELILFLHVAFFFFHIIVSFTLV